MKVTRCKLLVAPRLLNFTRDEVDRFHLFMLHACPRAAAVAVSSQQVQFSRHQIVVAEFQRRLGERSDDAAVAEVAASLLESYSSVEKL